MITKNEITTIALRNTFTTDLILPSDIDSAVNQYIKSILTEDLYDQVVASPENYLIGYIDTTDIVASYVSGYLLVNTVAVTGEASGVFTLAGHNLANNQEVIITKGENTSENEWTSLLADRVFVISDVTTDTFKLKESLKTKYIKPALAYYVIFDIFNALFVQISERGPYNLQSDYAQIISNQTRTDARNDIYRKAQSLSRILQTYIEDQVDDNVAVYIDYYEASDVEQVNEMIVNYGGRLKRSNHY